MSAKQKLILGFFIITYIFAPCISEAGAFSIVRCVFNTICGAAHTGTAHTDTQTAAVVGEKTQRLRISKPQALKRRRSRKKKVSDPRRRKKPFEKIKIATETPDNPDNKEQGSKKSVMSANSEKTAVSKYANDNIITDLNKAGEYDNAM